MFHIAYHNPIDKEVCNFKLNAIVEKYVKYFAEFQDILFTKYKEP